jgi:hypothetical protein
MGVDGVPARLRPGIGASEWRELVSAQAGPGPVVLTSYRRLVVTAEDDHHLITSCEG